MFSTFQGIALEIRNLSKVFMSEHSVTFCKRYYVHTLFVSDDKLTLKKKS